MKVELPLKEIKDPNWLRTYKLIMKDPFMRKKYSRKKRIESKIQYIDRYAPEIKKGGGFVIDIGPGPGEFLELCRYYGNDILGIDAPIGDSEMGDNYLSLSVLMTKRQEVPVKYIGFENLLKNNKALPFKSNSVSFINSQGSIEQVFEEHVVGLPIGTRKDTNKLQWNITTELLDELRNMFREFERILVPGGAILIYGNGTRNVKDYHKLILEIAKECSLKVEFSQHHRLHKIRKPA